MRQSRLLIPTLRDAPSDAEATSHRLMVRAGMIRQLAAGVYTLLPLGHRALRKLERIVRDGMEQAGAAELLLPALHPAELWRESGRWDAYGPELMRLTDRHGRSFALGATHEEAIVALVRDEVKSYRKLPLLLYQIQTKFRDERRPRFGLMRGREFLMKDAYSFDATPEGLEASYRRMYEAYTAIFTRCGLTFKAIEADSGSIGGTGTHEFVALADIGEDTIVHCAGCGHAANLELLAARPGDRCPRCGGELLFDKGIEVGHIFKLGHVYSEPMRAAFLDESGKMRPFFMGCYGIGLSRLLAAIVEQHHDDAGIVWPDAVAPFDVHLVAAGARDPAQTELADKLYGELGRAGFDVLYDDRDERTGVKFADADLIGLPVRITVGKRAAEGIVECKRRRNNETIELAAERVTEWLNAFFQGGIGHE